MWREVTLTHSGDDFFSPLLVKITVCFFNPSRKRGYCCNLTQINQHQDTFRNTTLEERISDCHSLTLVWQKKKTLARFNRKLNFQSRKESAYKKTLRNYRSCKDDGENKSDKCVSFADIRNESTKYSVCTQAVYWSIMQFYKMGTFKVVIIVQMDLYWFFVEYYIMLFVKWCSG